MRCRPCKMMHPVKISPHQQLPVQQQHLQATSWPINPQVQQPRHQLLLLLPQTSPHRHPRSAYLSKIASQHSANPAPHLRELRPCSPNLQASAAAGNAHLLRRPATSRCSLGGNSEQDLVALLPVQPARRSVVALSRHRLRREAPSKAMQLLRNWNRRVLAPTRHQLQEAALAQQTQRRTSKCR